MSEHQIEALLKYLSRLYLEYFHKYFEVCARVLVLHLKNWKNEEGSEQMKTKWFFLAFKV